MIGDWDLQIAVTALSLDYGLATLNEHEFSRVIGLRLVDVSWLARPRSRAMLKSMPERLKVLESAGLISRRRLAQLRPCKLETEQLKAVTHWLEQVQEIWEANYKRLDALLAELNQAQEERKKSNLLK